MGKLRCNCGRTLSNASDVNTVEHTVFTLTQMHELATWPYEELDALLDQGQDMWKCECGRIWLADPDSDCGAGTWFKPEDIGPMPDFPNWVRTGASYRLHRDRWHVRGFVDGCVIVRKWLRSRKRWHYEVDPPHLFQVSLKHITHITEPRSKANET